MLPAPSFSVPFHSADDVRVGMVSSLLHDYLHAMMLFRLLREGDAYVRCNLGRFQYAPIRRQSQYWEMRNKGFTFLAVFFFYPLAMIHTADVLPPDRVCRHFEGKQES
jgi:hypothetical protein